MLLHVSHFLLVSLCLGLESPPGGRGLPFPSLSRRTYDGGRVCHLIPLYLAISSRFPCFLAQVQSREKQHMARRPNALTLLPFYREALEALET